MNEVMFNIAVAGDDGDVTVHKFAMDMKQGGALRYATVFPAVYSPDSKETRRFEDAEQEQKISMMSQAAFNKLMADMQGAQQAEEQWATREKGAMPQLPEENIFADFNPMRRERSQYLDAEHTAAADHGMQRAACWGKLLQVVEKNAITEPELDAVAQGGNFPATREENPDRVRINRAVSGFRQNIESELRLEEMERNVALRASTSHLTGTQYHGHDIHDPRVMARLTNHDTLPGLREDLEQEKLRGWARSNPGGNVWLERARKMEILNQRDRMGMTSYQDSGAGFSSPLAPADRAARYEHAMHSVTQRHHASYQAASEALENPDVMTNTGTALNSPFFAPPPKLHIVGWDEATRTVVLGAPVINGKPLVHVGKVSNKLRPVEEYPGRFSMQLPEGMQLSDAQIERMNKRVIYPGDNSQRALQDHFAQIKYEQFTASNDPLDTDVKALAANAVNFKGQGATKMDTNPDGVQVPGIPMDNGGRFLS
ncbi:MAG: hypothetical protein SFX19_04270 [Alphaproteobacteria bacterium]|nr:hypothetical protein [Alphaproteobacteria bacterium]